MDLLEYAKDLAERGNASATHNSHLVYLKSLTIKEPSKLEAETKPKTEQTNSKSSHANIYLLVSGLILLLGLVLALGH